MAVWDRECASTQPFAMAMEPAAMSEPLRRALRRGTARSKRGQHHTHKLRLISRAGFVVESAEMCFGGILRDAERIGGLLRIHALHNHHHNAALRRRDLI